MDDSIIPPMPDFLKAKNRRKSRKPREVKQKWVMPEKKETRSQRRQRKEDHDKMVVAAVKSGADTFHKIRKELGDGWETNDISNALRRCTKARTVTKSGRRYNN